MFTEDETAFLARTALTMQIIVAALAGGVAMFLAASLFIAQPKPAPAETLLTYIAVAVAPAAILVALFVPGFVIRSQRQAILAAKPTFKAGSKASGPPSEAEQSLGPYVAGYQTALIIRSAILEGAAFFCLVTYILEAQTLSLIAAVVLLLFMLSGMPTRGRLEEAVERERRAVRELREMGSIDAQ